jgi:hypothetical protein
LVTSMSAKMDLFFRTNNSKILRVKDEKNTG